jgi:hypothetical protein
MSTFQKVTHRDGKKLRVNLDLARVAAATDKDGCEIQFSPDHVVTAGETVEKVMTIPSPLDEARLAYFIQDRFGAPHYHRRKH